MPLGREEPGMKALPGLIVFLLAAIILVVIIASAVASTAGEAEGVGVRLEIIETDEFRDSTVKSDAVAKDAIEIAEGEPVHLRITLINDSDEPSPRMNAKMDPRGGSPFRLMLTRPDGQVERLNIGRWQGGLVGIRPHKMAPREEGVLETWIYGTSRTKVIDRRIVTKTEYAFDGPGTYTLHAEFNGLRYTHPDTDLIYSNEVEIEVGPPIKNWEALQEANFVRFMNSQYSPGYSPKRHARIKARVDRIAPLLEDADVESLNVWLLARREDVRRWDAIEEAEREAGDDGR